jgi:hypothetical protein
VTSCALISGFIDQPTTRRENRSITAARWSQPSAVQTWVKSAIHLRLGWSAVNWRSSTFGAIAEAERSSSSFGRARLRGRAQRLRAHQTFDLVQAARKARFRHVAQIRRAP